MGIAERKEKQKLEIRKLILDASLKIIQEEGFEQLTMRKIADLIEYSATTVYLYFKDKNELFFHLHTIGFSQLTEKNQNLLTISNPLLRLYKMGENYIEFGLKNPELYDIMFIQRAPMATLEMMVDCDWSHGDAALGQLKNLLTECMDRKLIQPAPVEAVAMAIWGMVHGLVSLAIRDRLKHLLAGELDKTARLHHTITTQELKESMHQSLNWLISTIDKQ
ncbi:MAG: TetR/AcrR family transcriptional regulator [Chitinophagales bacterium]|nr:TetR/AcrR family transcriptional regulator [Chitinophagales bacterium]